LWARHAHKTRRRQWTIIKEIEKLVKQLSLDEKITMLSGDSTGFNGAGIGRLGIPPIKMADGPVGVRVGAATAFPVSVNMAASWDTNMIYRYGVALGAETRAKGKTVILGPCVGIQRFPLGGRNFESLGEDTYLSSRLAVNYVKGVQKNDVMATIKHYACNDQEWQRNFYDVIVDERSLRETHLAPFEAAVKEAGVRAVMTSYNIINGQHASENRQLVKEILKEDWGFKGIVMSDWVSVYSAVDAANNGLDIEMPRAIWFGDSLKKAVENGSVKEEVINEKIRRHLWARFDANLFENGNPQEDQSVIESEGHQALALEMAQKSIVLALNRQGTLPLDKEKVKSIALIGPHAKEARTGGGGSSIVWPWRKVSPYDGLKALLGENVKIEVAEGVTVKPFEAEPIPSKYLRTPDGRPGLLGEYFNNQGLEGEPVFTRIDTNINFGFGAGSPDERIKNDDYRHSLDREPLYHPFQKFITWP
jgi:beta-glucosidase